MGEIRWGERKFVTTHSLPLPSFAYSCLWAKVDGPVGVHTGLPAVYSWTRPSWLLCLECSSSCVLCRCLVTQGVSKLSEGGIITLPGLPQNPRRHWVCAAGKAHPVPWEGPRTRCRESPFWGPLSSSVWGGQLEDLPGACSASIKWTEPHHEFLEMLVLPLDQCPVHQAPPY